MSDGGGSSLTKALSTRLFGYPAEEEKKEEDHCDSISFLNSDIGPKIADIIDKHVGKIHDDSFLKIIRQLEFWHSKQISENEMLALAERLCKSASWKEQDKTAEGKFTVPKTRFGKTELQMPIITCGGMRLQETWIPDTIPLLKSNKEKVVKSKSQTNLKGVVLACIKLGLNHFETARFYGSSEIQMATALKELMDEGVVKREDFIFQTKVFPSEKIADFEKQWEASWSNVKQLGHVDLLSFHCISHIDQMENTLSDAEDGIFAFVKKLQKEGKIHHIGFSTHGDASIIYKLVDSGRFDYINVHKHFFGDYHAAGTPDGLGGQGNAAAVKRALELDMGVFGISPFDKGGKLYRPSAAVASAIGPEMSPIAFAALSAWKTQRMHTVSVGFARSSDLDEVIEAAALYAKGDEAAKLVEAAEKRLTDLAIDKLGKDWHEKGLLNIPSYYESKTDGIAIGHCLWIHNCLSAYGKVEFCRDRYSNLESASAKWSKKKTFEENKKKCFNPGNSGRSFDETVDLTEALKSHYDPELAMKKLSEIHSLMKKGNEITEAEKEERGWQQAYNLTTWQEFPGETITMSNVLMGRLNVALGRDTGTGPSGAALNEAETMRRIIKQKSTSP